MLSIDGAWEQAYNLLETGKQEPSIKLACWTCALSANNRIGRNGRQARLLAPLVNEHGVQAKEFYKALRREGYVGRNHISYLVGIQELDDLGLLDVFLNKPGTWDEWLAWRDSLVATVKGLGYKTASMVAMLLWPLECPFAVIDRHVMARLGIVNSKGNQPSALTRRAYLLWENTIRAEAHQAGFQGALVVWHWYKWEEWRQANAKTIKRTGGYESHNNLSCRWY